MKEYKKNTIEISLGQLKAINSLLIGGEPSQQLTAVLNDLMGVAPNGELGRQKVILMAGLTIRGLQKINTTTRYRKMGRLCKYQYISHSFILGQVVVKQIYMDKNGEEWVDKENSSFETTMSIEEFENMATSLEVALDE